MAERNNICIWYCCKGSEPTLSATLITLLIIIYASGAYDYLYIYESSVNLTLYLYLFLLIKLCLSLSLSLKNGRWETVLRMIWLSRVDVSPVLAHYLWNGNVVILMKFPSLTALKIVILTTFSAAIVIKIKMTTFSAAGDKNFVKMTTLHYNDVTMGGMASQITSLTIVYSTVYSKK